MTPEGKVLKDIKAWLKAKGITFIRMALQPGVQVGWPDLMVLLPGGMAVFVEVKAAGKKPTPIQKAKLELLSERGFLAFWTDDANDAIRFLLTVMADLAHPAPKASAVGALAVHAEGR